jgi:hypothetical protein
MNEETTLKQRRIFNINILPYLIVCICLVVFFNNYGFFSKPKCEIITSDAHGYYGYLPAKFIYNDLSYNYINKINQMYYSNNPIPDFCVDYNGKRVNKYYIGSSILMFPFFVLAHIITKFSNYPADGYSCIYQYFIGLASLFYLFLGLFFINKTFSVFKINIFLSALILIGVLFCTNLYHYSIFQPGMSHVYSFALIGAFIYFIKRLAEDYSFKIGLIVITILGLITLCRPTNLIIVLIIPLFFDNIFGLIDFIKNEILKWNLVTYILIFISIISIQSYFWFESNGLFYIDSYRYEGFFFSDPHLFDFLFSFKKGFFVYTPFFILLSIAIILLIKKNLYKALVFTLFFTIICYILSSWWNWYYGGGFGMRSLIDFYPLFCFVIAIGLNGISFVSYILLTLFITITGIVNLIQDYQIRNYILHWDCMDKEKYMKIFLKTEDKYKGLLFYDNSTSNFEKYHNGKLLFEDSCNFNRSTNKNINFLSALALKKSKSDSIGFVNESNQFSSGFKIPISQFLGNIPHIIVKTYADILINKGTEVELVISLEQNGTVQHWSSKVLPNFIDSKYNEWFKSQYHIVIYGAQTDGILKCYLHYRSGNIALIDNLKIKVCELKTKNN